jgi:hypothetical protein
MKMNRHSDFADLQETSSRKVANIRTTFSSKSADTTPLVDSALWQLFVATR